MLQWIIIAWLLPAVSFAQESKPAASSAMKVLVCYPGGVMRIQDAESAMGSMLRILEETGGWTPGTMKGLFATDVNDCKEILKEQKPHFAITTLGIFLECRQVLNLIPLVQPRINGSNSDTYRILVRKGVFSSLEELKGKTLGGLLVSEPEFLKRVVFQSKVDPVSFFELRESSRILRSLREVAKGELDAIIINSQQFRAIGSLPFANELLVVFTSGGVPLVGAVANKQVTTGDQRDRFSKALGRLCDHPDGKHLCELFGVDTFVPADMKAFREVIEQWDSRK